jgi:uncharacterized membrane protein YdjX (TVP38/TMEM64 family)
MSTKVVVRSLALFVSLVLLGIVFKATSLGTFFTEQWIDDVVRDHGIEGELIFLAVGALLTAIGLPRQLVAFLGGYGFGFIWGTLLATSAAAIGCVIAFFYSRLLGRDLVQHRFAERIRHVDDFLHDNPFTMTLLIRFLPLGSNLLTNLAAGVSSVRATPFIAGSAVGYLPQMIVFALVGSGITLDPEFRISVSIVLFVVSGVLGVHLYRKYRHGKSLDDAVDRELDAPGAGRDDPGRQ